MNKIRTKEMASATSVRHVVVKGDRRVFVASDESTKLTQIQRTHSPDDRDVDVRPILEIIHDVFNRGAPIIEGAYIDSSVEDNTSANGTTIGMAKGKANGMTEALASIIQKVSCELTCKCSGGDAHASTMTLLNMLSAYSWDAKVAITLGALAIVYGEFGLVVGQLLHANPLAKSVALLKLLPDLMEESSPLKPRFEQLHNLIDVMLDVTKKITEFKHLSPQYISPEQPPLSDAITNLIPNGAYWTIKSVLTGANLIASSYQYNTSTTDDIRELSNLYHNGEDILHSLTLQLNLCNEHIAYKILVREFKSPQHDNIKIFRHLIYEKDDKGALLRPSKKSRVRIEVLSKKIVMLLISDLKPSQEELNIMDQIYRESTTINEIQYEIIWIPVIDESWTEEHQKSFEQLRSKMSWLTLYDPKDLEPAFITYIKKVWKFSRKTMLVVLDGKGNVVSQNALYMYLIWGNKAFPFTATKEEVLWKEQKTWRLDLLFPQIHHLVSKEKYICVYGGENLERSREFATKIKKITQTAGIDLEIIYVGKSNAIEKTTKISETLKKEGLINYTVTALESFWVRLKGILYCKLQHGKNGQDDEITREVMTVLSFDGSDQVWATVWFGLTEMTRAKGDVMLDIFSKFNEWQADLKDKGFIAAISDQLKVVHQTSHHCNRIILPGVNGRVPEKVICADCGKEMEKYFMYRCCTE